jgi:hypothetical protein
MRPKLRIEDSHCPSRDQDPCVHVAAFFGSSVSPPSHLIRLAMLLVLVGAHFVILSADMFCGDALTLLRHASMMTLSSVF